MPAPVAHPRCRGSPPSAGTARGPGRPPSATAAPAGPPLLPCPTRRPAHRSPVRSRASRSARVEHMLELYGVAPSLSGDPADRQSVTDRIPGVTGRARVGGRLGGCTPASARPRSPPARRSGRASRGAAGAPARALTCNVRRQIPVWITFRHCGSSYRLRTFFHPPTVDGISAGRTAAADPGTAVSTAVSPGCAQPRRRVCTVFPQAVHSGDWTPRRPCRETVVAVR